MIKNRIRGTVRFFAIAFTLLVASPYAYAKEYGSYDTKKILTVSETPSGKNYKIDSRYLDQILGDLSLHAKNYPPLFDKPGDQQRAEQDVRVLSDMLDVLVKGPRPHPEILLRAGLLNSIGYNLNISGSAEKTSSIFQKLLSIYPSHPRGNYIYGTFLAGATKLKEAIPYLERALSLGESDAAYALGMAYLSLEDTKKALEYLEGYQQKNPSDTKANRLIEAIRSGKLEIKRVTN